MSPMQQIFLGMGAVAKKTYVDDIFSTFLYKGTGSARQIVNGIDLSGEGGLVWIKNRDASDKHILGDTVRGVNKYISSNSSAAETNDGSMIMNIHSNAFSVGAENEVNTNGEDYSSWTFRKAPGCFDVVSWTGNSDTNQTISHSLASVPGMIIAKRTDSSTTGDWVVYHRDHVGYLKLNSSNSAVNDSGAWTPVTSTSFKAYDYINVNGASYVAYVFAGGESTDATARSVEFDGSNDYLSIPDNDAWDISSSDATIECWVNFDSHNGHDGIIHNLHSSGLPGNGTSAWALEPVSGTFNFYWGTTAGGYGNVQGAKIPLGQWQHLAVTKSGSTITLYQDGVKTGSGSISGTINPGVVPLNIGGNCVGEYCDCKISNVRITKGQVLYTSSFKLSTVPLTTTSQGATASNVKLLCCNNSSATGSSVTPDTITNNNGSTASTDSPFDDPAGFVFGDAGDQNVIKCGSYKTDSNEDAIVNLGWEPQWVLAKRTDSSSGGDWMLYDSMRGLSNKQDVLAESGVSSALLVPNNANSETNARRIGVDATGFVQDAYGANREYIYCAIRRPDGYVGKPPELGTAVFAMDGTANGSNVFPQFTSGFPVDFSLTRNPTQSGTWDSWHAGARLLQGTYQLSATSNAWSDGGNFQYDYNDGIFIGGWTHYMSWMWKRHAGFDVVTYKGNGTAGNVIFHSLSQSPQMTWIKRRDGTSDWSVWHIGLNNGSSNLNYEVRLNVNNAERNWGNITAMDSTSFTLGGGSATNGNNDKMIAMLFASVNKISKVGYYTGNGSSTGPVISLGFTPRFILFKNASSGGNGWAVLDTVRGLGTSSQKRIWLDGDWAQDSGNNYVTTTSTSFQPVMNNTEFNENGSTIIYYAHA